MRKTANVSALIDQLNLMLRQPDDTVPSDVEPKAYRLGLCDAAEAILTVSNRRVRWVFAESEWESTEGSRIRHLKSDFDETRRHYETEEG